MERENVITFKGGPLTLVGEAVSVGQAAPISLRRPMTCRLTNCRMIKAKWL